MATINKAFRVKSGLAVEGGAATFAGGAIQAAAGTTSYPPILLTSGTNLTSATAGAFEYDGTNFYLTPASTRKTISFTDHVHGNITAAGAIGSTSGLVVLTGASGVLTALAAGTTSQYLRGDGSWQTVSTTDTNYYPSAIVFNAGTTAGPTLDLTMSGAGAPDLTAVAIPSAAVGASGVVTTGAQEFGGVKTLTSPAITTSLTTGSTTFALVNTTATTVNFAGAATALNVGASTGNTTVNNNLVVTGNLTVNGTTTTVNSTTVTVDDIVLELGAVTTPTDTTANGGGISLLGATNKTILWDSANSNWTSSENWNLATGKVFKINNASVLSATALGSAVVSSSLTSVGTIGTGTWQGTVVAGQYGGTGVNNSGKTITLGGNLTTSGAYATTLTATAATSVTLPTTGTLISNRPDVSSGSAIDNSLLGQNNTASGGLGGSVYITAGSATGVGSQGGYVRIKGGASTTGNTGGVIIDGGGDGTNDPGGVSIGSTVGTSYVGVGKTAQSVSVAGVWYWSDGYAGLTVSTPLTSTVWTGNSANFAAKIMISAKTASDVHMMELLVIMNGAGDLYTTQYGEIISNNALFTYAFSPGSLGALDIVVTPVGATSTDIFVSAQAHNI